jgi:hypothetical protein
MASDAETQRFIDAWREVFGEELPALRAREELDGLCRFILLLTEAHKTLGSKDRREGLPRDVGTSGTL